MVTDSGEHEIVSVKVAATECARVSVTVIVNVKVPETLGVPDMTPVEVLRLRPVGNDPVNANV